MNFKKKLNIRRPVRGAALAAGLAVGATTMAVVGQNDFAKAASVPNITCDGDDDLVMTTPKTVQQVNRVTGTAVPLISGSGAADDAAIDIPGLFQLNQVGVTQGGTDVLFTGLLPEPAGTEPPNAYWIFDEPVADLTDQPAVRAGGGVAAAIDPISELFYFGNYDQPSESISLNVYDLNSGAVTKDVLIVEVPNAPGTNGDLAFDDEGTLYLVNSGTVNAGTPDAVDRYAAYSVEGPLSKYTVGDTVTASEFANGDTASDTDKGGVINGIAFGSDNHLWTSGNEIREFSLEFGFVSSIPLRGTDLASCVNPTRVRVYKNLPAGRVADGDQFGIEIQNADGTLSVGNTATTFGTESGRQEESDSATGVREYIGPLITELNSTYTITETASGTTDLANYLTTWECVDVANDATLASGEGTTGTFVTPASVGSNVECEFTNVPKPQGTITIQKNLPDGRVADTDQFTLSLTPGDATAVTTTGTESGIQAEKLMLDPAVPGTAYTFTEAGSGTTNLDLYDTTWSCVDTASDAAVVIASGAGTSGGVTLPQTTNPAVVCTFINKALQPNLVIAKSSNPVKGTALKAGELVTYTLSFDNSSGEAPTAIDFVDDLNGVLDDATVTVNPALATGTGLTVSGITDGRFTIKGELAAGETATVTYTAKVKPNGERGDNLLVNYLLKPGEIKDKCLDDDPLCTKHPVPETPAIDLIKAVASVTDSDESGNNTVGDIVNYQFTVTNTGTNVLNDVELLDPKLSSSPLTCPKTTLKVGERMVCSGATYVITAADLANGAKVDNTATVSGVDSAGTKVTDTSSASVPVTTSPTVAPPTTLPPTTVAPRPPVTGSASAQWFSIAATFFLMVGSSLLLLSRMRQRRA